MPAHILQIVIKNTSTIDYTLPLFGDISNKRPEVRLSILYCVFDKRQILRKSRFYSDSLKKYRVQEYDFADFLKQPYKSLSFFFRWMFSKAPADKIHIREKYRSYRAQTRGSRPVFSFMFYLFKNHSVTSLASSAIRNFLLYLERKMGPRIISLEKILPDLNADIFLFDNRAKTPFYGRDLFYKYFDQVKRPVILVPHALHLRDPVSEFCPFDEKGHPLPDYCDFWVPLRFGTPWVQVPERKAQFALIGYPGLDSQWLTFLRQKGMSAKPSRNNQSCSPEIKCLFIARRYVPAGETRPPDLDPFIVDYDDFFVPLKTLAEAVDRSGRNVKVIIKPHPSNNYTMLAGDIRKIGLKNWAITYEPVYALLGEVEIVVSLFSTILLLPAVAGIPTIVLNSKLQQHVHQQWDLLREIYMGMRYYVENVEQLPKIFCDIVTEIGTGGNGKAVSHDIDHLRKYFPDGATAFSLKRINMLTNDRNLEKLKRNEGIWPDEL